MEGAEILRQLGVSTEEMEAVSMWQSKALGSEDADAKHAEWLQQRCGKFTASEFHRLMTYPARPELPAGAITYVEEKVVETLTQEPKQIRTSAEMQHGNDMEPVAVAMFEELTGVSVHKHTTDQEFIIYQDVERYLGEDINLADHVGCTPDGLIGDDMGLETKCPNSKTHLEYMLTIRDGKTLKEKKPEYYWQIQGSMMVTGRKAWAFMSYDDRFEDERLHTLLIRVDRNEVDIEHLRRRLVLAIHMKQEKIKFYQAIGLKKEYLKALFS